MATNCANCPLRKRPAFDRLDADELAFMQRFKVGELSVDKGTTLLMEGSNSPQLFTVLSGMGLRYKLLENGKRQVINFALPGDFLGLQAGVMGEMKHSVEATTRMELCVFDRANLWILFKQQPARAYALTWIASIQEHFLGESLASIGQTSAVQRMSWGLLRFHDRCVDIGIGRNGEVPMPYTQQDLADALGLSLVHTNKTLRKLRDTQVLSWNDGALRILDRDKAASTAMYESENGTARPLI